MAISKGLLALSDGSLFWGRGYGASGLVSGELCFNTAMTGYQEILTDPSYTRQVVMLTYPHIGNVGVNRDDAESGRVCAAGLVIRDLPTQHSNWRSERDLDGYLQAQGVGALAGVDTRQLTRIVRERGAQNVALAVGEDIDVQATLAAARGFPGLNGMDLAQDVSVREPYHWLEGSWGVAKSVGKPRRVVVYDYGVKRNILRMLVDRACQVTVVPARMAAAEVLNSFKPDGVLFSNGPGDPQPVDYGQQAVRDMIAAGIPSFGICLGHQLLCLALGAKSLKMKFGHHGANHPVKDLDSGRVFITSQNHGFAIDADSLPDSLRVTHVSLFDGSLQGVAHRELPVLSFQGHPEASPGPHEVGVLFDRFVQMMDARHA